MATEKRKVIRVIPSGNRSEASHVASSRWACPEVPGGEIIAGRVVEVSAEMAAYLVAKKGFSYVGSDGKPTDEKASLPNVTEPRPGTAEWYDAEFVRLVDAAAADTTASEAPAAPVEEKKRNRSTSPAPVEPALD